MASSSNNNFYENSLDDTFDEFDQTIENVFETAVDAALEYQAPTKAKKKRAYIKRQREIGDQQLWNDYFLDEYLRLGETTALRCLENFVEGIINVFGEEYLRRPTPDDLQWLLDVGENCGFPGMIGSIDCMHWEWKICPTAWKGQYTRGSGKPTIVLEAVALYDLWIWHAFFGPPGTLNDINVLDRSPVFDDVLQGRAPKVSYGVNGRQYRLAYYLTDGIYLKWAAFVQSIPSPQGEKAKAFAKRQESVRKDVERAFGVLQVRFAIIKNPALFWDKEKIGKIMRACIILHNMIVENERNGYTQFDTKIFEQGEGSGR
ncbi:uncharacterized protein LOC112088076 [Eutrema salsugineum]|uniref:uncharacterized protein LOC112088076 n=1 Tax=Eutrema salsugineum TaxID=72664 RepID=UPI000CED035F|nr:uncharacterized protein LOC112088076 [Eutrema salsugineum]